VAGLSPGLVLTVLLVIEFDELPGLAIFEGSLVFPDPDFKGSA
jgi:hypothetical protein